MNLFATPRHRWREFQLIFVSEEQHIPNCPKNAIDWIDAMFPLKRYKLK